MVGIGGVVRLDESVEECVFFCFLLDEFERAVSVNGDVVPSGDRDPFGVERGRNIAMRSREDDERLAAGECPPMRIGLGEVPFE